MNPYDSPTLSDLYFHEKTLPGGLKVDGERFPPGVDLSVPAYTLHPNAEYFPDQMRLSSDRSAGFLLINGLGLVQRASRLPTASEAIIDIGLEVARSAFMPFGIWQNFLRREIPGVSRDITYHCQGGLAIRYAYPTSVYSW